MAIPEMINWGKSLYLIIFLFKIRNVVINIVATDVASKDTGSLRNQPIEMNITGGK